MEATGYRSYVIRVWSRARNGGAATRAVIEEVQSGLQVELRGERAAEISSRIAAALVPGQVARERAAEGDCAPAEPEHTPVAPANGHSRSRG